MASTLLPLTFGRSPALPGMTISFAILLAGLAAHHASHAANINVAWCGGATGNWSDTNAWGENTFTCSNFNPVPPNNGGGDFYFVAIDSYDDPLTGPGLDRNGNPLNTLQPSTVSLDINATISHLLVGNNDVLSMNNGTSLIIENALTPIQVYGRLEMNSSNASPSNTILTLNDGQTLSAIGELVLNDDADNFVQTNNSVITNGSDFTIRGSGFLLNNSGGMINQGTIIADGTNVPLLIDPNALGFDNQGDLIAAGAAGLELGAGNYVNTGRTIQVQNGSHLDIMNGTVINGGTLQTTGTGAVNVFNTILNGMTSEARVNQGNGQFVQIGGGLVNNNRWEMNSLNTSTANTVLTFLGNETLTGTGELVLTDDDDNFVQTNNSVLTHDINHTIRGSGFLLNNTGGMVNLGTIIADGNDHALVIDPNALGFVNQGSITATGAAGLAFAAGTFTNTGQTLDIQNGSRLDLLNGSVVNGGTLQTTGTGVVNVFNTILNGVTSQALIRQGNGQFVQIGGGLVNNNRWEMNSTNGSTSNTVLTFNGTQTLTGSGELVLTDDDDNFIQTNNTILTHDINHTIRGSGFLLNNSGGMINRGTIIANGNNHALVIDPNTLGFVNQGSITATGAAGLAFAAGTFTNTGQTLDIQNGSRLDLLNGSVINGGTLQTTGTGVVNAFNTTLNGVTSQALIKQGNGQFVQISGGLVNNNRWEMNSTNGSTSNTVLTFNGTQTLTGSGELVLTDDDDNFIQTSNTILTHDINHTIRGSGFLLGNSGGMINRGTIIADGDNFALVIDPNSLDFTNQGTLTASGAAGIDFGAGDFNNTGRVIQVLDGSRLDLLNASRINGGTLQTTGTGTVFASNTTFDTVTSEALIKHGNAQLVTMLNGFVNNNRYEMDSTNASASNTILTFNGAQTISGTGELVLTDDDDNFIQTNNTVITNETAHTISGAGQLLNNTGGMINRGTIIADGTNNSLNIDANSLGFDNQGTLQATGSAGINVLADGFTNSGQVTIAAASQLSRTGDYTQTGGNTHVDGTLNATATVDIQGGVLSGNGTINGNVSNAGTVAPGTSPGTLTINGDYSQDTSGALAIEISGLLPDTGYDVLDINGDAVLGGLLSVSLTDGFIPGTGVSFDILTADNLFGTFDSLDFSLALDPLVTWEIGYLIDELGTTDVVRLRVLDVAPVPVPAAVWLFGSGIIVLATFGRRRKK